MLTVTFEKRDFSGPALAQGVRLEVERLSWRAVGGPWAGRLRAEAGAALGRLWDLTGLLRCGVKIHGAAGVVWWGYLSAVEIHQGARVARVGLDGMWNRVMVRYRDFSPLESAGVQSQTPPVTNADSVKLYGEKARVFAAGQSAPGEAAALAAAMLARYSKPAMTLSASRGGESSALPSALPYALLELRGWWETLDWQFYADGRGLVWDASPGVSQNLGDAAANTKAAHGFTTSGIWQASEAWVKLRREMNPADSVRLDLCAEAAGIPGAALASAVVAGSQVADSPDWVRFAFAAPVALTVGTYWLVLSRTGALDGALHYGVSVDQGNNQAGGGPVLLWNGSAWVARVPAADMNHYVIGVEETAEQARRVLAASACGQFLRGARVEQPSGVLGRVYHDGGERGRALVESLLRRGTAAGARLLARVEPDRTARIFAQPEPGAAALQIDQFGHIVHAAGAPLLEAGGAAGQWARLGDLSTAAGLLGYSGAVFIESCAWTKESGLVLGEG